MTCIVRWFIHDDWFKDDPLTVDMQIVYPVHNLLEYTAFSIFDLLWVRNFNIELWTELDYQTDNCRDEEDPDFDQNDYWDIGEPI